MVTPAAAAEKEQSRAEKEQQGQQSQRMPAFLAADGAASLVLATDRFDHAPDAGDDAAVEVAQPEVGDDLVVDDPPGEQVGEAAFEPVADLDAHLALLFRHQQQGAVVLALLSQSPGSGHFQGVVFERLALE